MYNIFDDYPHFSPHLVFSNLILSPLISLILHSIFHILFFTFFPFFFFSSLLFFYFSIFQFSFSSSMSAAGRIGTSDLVDRTYRFVKKVREDEEAAAPKVIVPKSIDSDLYEEEDSVYS